MYQVMALRSQRPFHRCYPTRQLTISLQLKIILVKNEGYSDKMEENGKIIHIPSGMATLSPMIVFCSFDIVLVFIQM